MRPDSLHRSLSSSLSRSNEIETYDAEKYLSPTSNLMRRRLSEELLEAEELLEKLESWSDEEIEELPELYQRKAREYRGLLNHGED